MSVDNKPTVRVNWSFGKYVIRVNGFYVCEFFFKGNAYQAAYRLQEALEN